jgi:hypothetical protein
MVPIFEAVWLRDGEAFDLSTVWETFPTLAQKTILFRKMPQDG